MSSKRRRHQRRLQRTHTGLSREVGVRDDTLQLAEESVVPGGSTARLMDLVAIRSEAAAAVDDEVRKLAASGIGWGEIGRALAVSRQAARQKYGGRGPAR